MEIQKIGQSISNFSTRLLKNKTVLKSLEKISDHGTSFSASTSFALSLTVRPMSIFLTPDTEKENKQYAAANSICSGVIKFGIVESIALPIENAVKNIDKHPTKFLTNKTIKNLIKNNEIEKSRSYKLITQMFKLGTGFLTAVPKSMLTLALIPILMDNVFFKNKQKSIENSPTTTNTKEKSLNFTGHLQDKLSKGFSKIINSDRIQNLANKYQNKDKDIAKHMTAATDILLTTSFAVQTSKSNKIKENRKKALIYNNVISTFITLTMGYGIDNLIKKKTGKFVEKFKKINATNPKVEKYIEGINILRPALIFAGIYYGILPLFSTFMAEKVDKYIEKHSNRSQTKS